jgi:hypothetical protein
MSPILKLYMTIKLGMGNDLSNLQHWIQQDNNHVETSTNTNTAHLRTSPTI